MKRKTYFLLLILLTVFMFIPPIHEGLHVMACEFYCKEVVSVEMNKVTCAMDNPGSKERYFTIPYLFPFAFLALGLSALVKL